MASSTEKAAATRVEAQTVIGNTVVIEGEISGAEVLVVHGTVKGKIAVKDSLFVDGAGTIEADVETGTLEVAGQVTGSIVATERVELKPECKVVGDIRSPRILIADGALFKGSVDMDVKGK